MITPQYEKSVGMHLKVSDNFYFQAGESFYSLRDVLTGVRKRIDLTELAEVIFVTVTAQ